MTFGRSPDLIKQPYDSTRQESYDERTVNGVSNVDKKSATFAFVVSFTGVPSSSRSPENIFDAGGAVNGTTVNINRL